MQDACEPSAGRDQATAQYANLEAGGLSEMPIMPKGQVRPAGSYDPADRDVGDHAVRLGSPGRRTIDWPLFHVARSPIRQIRSINKSRADFLVSFEQLGRLTVSTRSMHQKISRHADFAVPSKFK